MIGAQVLGTAPARVAALPRPLRMGAFAVLGAVLALGQVPVSWPVAALAALVLAFVLARRGAGFAEGWALGLGHFAVALRWIVEPFLVEPERTGWMAPFALLFMAGGLALFWGAAFGLARRLRLGVLGLAALWAGAEALRSIAFTGFPWALVGHVWIDTPLVQVAAVTGQQGLTLLTLLAAAVMAEPRMGLGRLAVPGALVAGAVLLRPGPAPALGEDAPVVRIVQPNVPQAEKYDPEKMPEHLERLLSLSARQREDADLVVWPETALPDLLEWAGPTLVLGVEAGGAPVATGVVRRDDAGRFFNSLAVTDGQGAVRDLYDKAHLVPFGEYIPFRGSLTQIGLGGLAEMQGEGFAAGTKGALIDLPGIGRARPLICYEGIFPEEFGAERPRLLLLVTNDAWFGKDAGPQQHFALGRLRAVEFGLPLVRAANTGISGLIDGEGRVLASLPLDEAGALEVRLPPALAPTPYARLGDWPAYGLGLLVLLGAAIRRRGIDPRGGQA